MQMTARLSAHSTLVLGSALLGTVLTQLRFTPLTEVFLWDNWNNLSLAGTTAGGLLGHLAWAMARPRARTTRAALVCTLANVLVWLSFLTFTPPLDDGEFRRVEIERLQRDANPGHLDLVSDQPIVVAGRWHGTFGAVNFADWLLTLVAAPAIAFAELLIVPSGYIGIDATKGESFAIAGLGFLLSTAFWIAFGELLFNAATPKQRTKAKAKLSGPAHDRRLLKQV